MPKKTLSNYVSETPSSKGDSSINNFSEGVSKIYDKTWDFVSNFAIEIVTSSSGTPILDVNDLNISVVSASMPSFACNPIEFFSAGQWVIANGRDEVLTCSITLRDYNYMENYKTFLTWYATTKESYPADVYMRINFYKRRDTFQNGGEDLSLIMSFNECLLSTISEVQFNNSTENQLVEFTIGFKVISPIKWM